MKNSLGQQDQNDNANDQDDSNDENGSDDDKQDKKKNKKNQKANVSNPDKMNMQKTLNMQSLITKQIFDYVAGGNVQILRQQQAQLGFKQPDDIAFL